MRIVIIKSLIFFLLIVLLSCKKRGIEVEPPTSQQYTSQMIDSLLYAFGSSTNHDTKPNHDLFQAFIKDFPDAKDIDWKISNFIYCVELEINNRDYKAFYDQETNLISYRYEISETDLPAIVKNSSVAVHPDYNFEEVEKIVKGNDTLYQLNIEKQDDERILIIKNNGVVLADSTKQH